MTSDIRGVAVWCFDWSRHGRDFNDEFVHADDLDTTEPLEYDPGAWHPMSREAQDKRRAAVGDAISDVWNSHARYVTALDAADAVLALLGLASDTGSAHAEPRGDS